MESQIPLSRIKENGNELYLSNSFIPTLAEATVVGAMVLDIHYKVLWINQAALKTTGLRKTEAMGKYCFRISHNSISPCDSPNSPCPMKETLRTGKSAHVIHEHSLKEGNCYCDVSTFPLFNGEGEVVQVLEIIRDITDDLNDTLERRTRTIKKDLSRLVQEDKLISLGKMVASVAHEINNPIGSILNFNALMLKTITEGRPTDEDLNDFKRYLELSVKEAGRCGKIVNNLLSFSRQQAIESKGVDLGELLGRIALLTQHKMKLAGIRFTLDCKGSLLQVWGDYTQIQQCFTNFVFNAIEAMPNGGDLLIEAGNDQSNSVVWVKVNDTGVGIPKENIKKVFEPFFTTKSAVNGVGLGLSMVYGIIKRHGGSIRMESVVGNGTTVYVTLPQTAGRDNQAGGFTSEQN